MRACTVACPAPHALSRSPDEHRVRALLRTLPVGHEEARAALAARHAELFPRWKALLHANFSLLCHGFGSKKCILDAFRDTSCDDGACVVVHGASASLRPRAVLAAAAAALASHRVAPGALRTKQVAELLELVEAATRAEPPRRLYLLVHSIDGPALRTPDAQAQLARLACIPGVHLVASCDGVNAPLLWHKRLAAQFRWVWEHCPTFAPYDTETETAPQLLSGGGEARLRRGAASVLQSLTPNARSVFRILAAQQLKHEEQGLSFDAWFRLCRAAFAVSAEGQLRAHLGEFSDHGLVKRVRRADGVEAVVLQFSDEDLNTILEDIGPTG